MKKKSGNPTWGKADMGPAPAGATSFEEVVKRLGLSPDEYLDSPQLKDWVRKNKDEKYVPSDLLKAWKINGEEGL
jgi:hypothetical protein